MQARDQADRNADAARHVKVLAQRGRHRYESEDWLEVPYSE